MKQTIYSILILVFVILTGCTNSYQDGKNDNGGGTPPPTSTPTPTPTPITNNTHFIKLKSPIEVTSDNAIIAINAYVVDAKGVGKEGVSVNITAIQDIKFGAITSESRVMTDSSGKASFTYQAPADIQSIDGEKTSVTLTLKDNGTVDKRVIELIFKKVSPPCTKSKPIVVLTTKDINLTNNNQTVDISIKVFEEETTAPYTKGTVKVKLPKKVKDGIDVGYFNEYEVKVGTNGIASFIYTGPQNLKDLISKNDLNSTFKFYHIDNPTQMESINIHYSPTHNYIPANYLLMSVSDNDKYTMGLQKTKSFTIYLKDDKGNIIDNTQIKKIIITSENMPIGQIINPDTNEQQQELIFENKDAINGQLFTINTNTVSGLLPINIKVEFIDANGESQQLSIKMNITVFSGPPTALSISYVGVEHDATIGKFIEKFAVSAVDAYNNSINTTPYISTGALVEYAVDGSSATGDRTTTSPRLWHGRFDTTATITDIGDNKAQLEAKEDAFKYIDYDNDKLVVFGKGYVYEALGKWDIKPNSDNTLDLVDDYYGKQRDGLYYAVGHNNRQDLCSNDGREYVGTMKSNTYQLDENGNVLIEFIYDYHLTGKDIMVWINLTGYQADTKEMIRIGETQKHTLRGMGFISTEKYKLAGFATDVHCYFEIQHKNIPEYYRNGHFDWKYTGCHVDGILNYSNFYDARDCINTTAFIELNVSNPNKKDCVIELRELRTSPEFKSSNAY
jgi:hypothetical protein